MGVKPNEFASWSRDAARRPFVVSCDTKMCFFIVAHPGPLTVAELFLERHMQSDDCPRPNLYHGMGIKAIRAAMAFPIEHNLDEPSDLKHEGTCEGTLCTHCGCCEHCAEHKCICLDPRCSCSKQDWWKNAIAN